MSLMLYGFIEIKNSYKKKLKFFISFQVRWDCQWIWVQVPLIIQHIKQCMQWIHSKRIIIIHGAVHINDGHQNDQFPDNQRMRKMQMKFYKRTQMMMALTKRKHGYKSNIVSINVINDLFVIKLCSNMILLFIRWEYLG